MAIGFYVQKRRIFSIRNIIIIGGFCLFFLFRFIFPPSQRTGDPVSRAIGSYALLTTDEGESDRQIRESLAEIGDFISESSQEILVDDFGSIKRIPLDRYAEEIEAFDPRDDGYAAKVHDFFVQDGKRFFFFPLESLAGNGFSLGRAEGLEKKIASLLGDIPHSFIVLSKKKDSALPIVLFIAACCVSLFLARSRRLYIFVFPALLAFGWGPSAFFHAGLLAGIWELLREPMDEILAARRYRNRFTGKSDYAGKGMRSVLERLTPFRLNLILVFLYLVLYAAFSIVEELPLLPQAALLAFFSLFYLLGFGLKAKQVRDNQHILFIPVLLPPYKTKTFSLFPVLLPFGAGALLSFILPLYLPNYMNNSLQQTAFDPRFLVSADDYSKHVAFQRSFSYASLNDGLHADKVNGQEFSYQDLMRKEYLRYYLGEDGLIAGSAGFSNNLDIESLGSVEDGNNFARFPLEKLMDFLVQYYDGGSMLSRSLAPEYFHIQRKEWIAVAILLALCLFDLAGPGKSGRRGKKVERFGEKRIAA